MKLIISLLCIAAIILFACNPPKSTSSTNTNKPTANKPNTTTDTKPSTNNDTEGTLLVFEKGGCFGTCPIYTLTIQNNGMAEDKGKRFTDRLGVHTKQLDKVALHRLSEALRKGNLWDLPDKFESRIPDLPSSTLTYMEGEKSKTIFWREKSNDALMDIGKMIETIGNNKDGWTIKGGQEVPASFIVDELIVQLKDEIDSAEFIKEFRQYGLTLKDRLMPSKNYWTMNYDTSKIGPYEMLNMVNRAEGVIGAEFNKKVTQRGN